MRGYTLLEIMIAIAGIAVIAAGGYPKLSEFAQEVRLEQEARIIYNDLCLYQDACRAAGTDFGTVNFIFANNTAGNPVIGYEMRDPFNPASWPFRPSLNDGSLTRDIGIRHVCIASAGSFDTIPASTTDPNICTIHFSKTGSPSVLFRIIVKSYEPESNRINENLGTYTISVDPETCRLVFSNESNP